MPQPASHDPLAAFIPFASAVLERLEAGRVAYADRSFSRSPAELVDELAQEALDLAGWGFVLWSRLQAMRAALGDVDHSPKLVAGGGLVSSGPRTDVGRLLVAARRGHVLVLPLLRQPDLTFAAAAQVELSRVPCAGELLVLPALGMLRVMVVRHTPGAPVDAELYLEPTPTTAERPGLLGEQPGPRDEVPT
jgi:hypothetical protein